MTGSPLALGRRAARYLRHRLAPRALLLMYHRVAELPADPQLLAVSPPRFAEQLAALRRVAEPLRLQELVERLRAGRLPRRAVVVTFDDGYADNLYQATPLLERHGVPATVFVSSGQIGCGREFWWDELERLALQPGRLPAELALELGGVMLRWEAGPSGEYGEEERQRHRWWDIEQAGEPGPRQRLYRLLYEHLHGLAAPERDAALERLRAWAGLPARGRPSHRTLSADELARLAGSDLIEVGAHTVSHPQLATLPPAEQEQEITQSKRSLELLLGRPVVSFAYPHGSYNAASLAAVRGAGFACACSSDTEPVWRDAPLFSLPRLVVRDWDGPTFTRWLRGWLGV